MRALRCCGRRAWLVVLTGACAAPRPPVGDPARSGGAPPEMVAEGGPPGPPEPTLESGPPGPPRDERGGAPGFVLESTLRARRIRNDQPAMSLELGNGDTVLDGDRLQVLLRTSQDAYLYLAFCSQRARDPRYPGLKVFPDRDAIHTRAYERTVVPDPAAEIVLDNQPGKETLYLILSRTEISSSDAGLAQVIAAARQGSTSADCGAPFQAAITGMRRAPAPRQAWSSKLHDREPPHPPPATTGGGGPRAAEVAEPDPVVEIQRGGDIVWNNGTSAGLAADPDGIVVLRYGLMHVAAPP